MTSTMAPPPPRPDERVESPTRELWRIRPSTAVLASLLVGGLAVDIGVRHPAGVLTFVMVGLLVAAGFVGGWIRGPLARRLAALALVPASMLLLRDSSWLTTVNLITALALVVLASAVRTEPHAIARALGRLGHPVGAMEPAALSIDLVARSARAAIVGRDHLGRRLMRLVRGIAIGAPVVIVLASLLAASDALFRSWFALPFDLPTAVGHVFIIAMGATSTAVLAGHGAWAPIRPATRPNRILGPTEASIVLLGVLGVYAVFVVTQVIAIAAGADYIQRTTGLTYAEYARAGFFQLVAAAVLTLLVLVLLRRHRRCSSPRLARRLMLLELSTVGLTLVVVGVAIRRLFLYEAEFGLTMLRFATIVFALFIGFVFVVTGLKITGRLRRDAAAVVLFGALAVVVAVNLANPERIVAQRNIDRFSGTEQLDIGYLVDNLGADALPVMLTDPIIERRLCHRPPAIDDRVVAFNWSRDRAAAALEAACG